MTKRNTGRYKIDRRMGEKTWRRPKSLVNRREYGPGLHGQRRKGKMSNFGLQLQAKQRLKGFYGDLTEKQFRRIFYEALRLKGDTAENLIGLLERRLDTLVYRSKFASTMFIARQLVNHGHILVNGKRTNIPSYRVRVGDVIEVREQSKQTSIVLEATLQSDRNVPEYVFADHSEMIAKLMSIPSTDDVSYPVLMEPELVVAYFDDEALAAPAESVASDHDLDTQEPGLSAEVFGKMFRGRNSEAAVDLGRWDEVFDEVFGELKK